MPQRYILLRVTALILLFALLAFALSACGTLTNKTTVTEYDADGKAIRTTVTNEAVASKLMESTKDKTVVLWDNSFLAYISASAATVDDPTPTVRMGLGRADKGMITIHKGHNLKYAPDIIKATRTGTISLTPSDITTGQSGDQTSAADAKSDSK